MMKKIIVCLGNPGVEYEMTRHNLGFMFADIFSDKFKFDKDCFLSFCETEDFFIVKPMTFMNVSGRAVQCVLKVLDADAEDIIVVCDDFNLPFGKLRLRQKGSSGGHNGLQSIIDFINTDKFIRLRMGIGGADEQDKTSYVLEKFKKNELKKIEDMLIDGRKIVNCIIKNGIENAMNKFN